MKQQLGSFDVAQKAIAKSVAFVRAFDQSGYVGNYESAEVSEIDHA
jgi:hypothetical protein